MNEDSLQEDIEGITRDSYKHLYACEFNNLDEISQLLASYKLLINAHSSLNW